MGLDATSASKDFLVEVLNNLGSLIRLSFQGHALHMCIFSELVGKYL